jgi:hypothetical protein
MIRRDFRNWHFSDVPDGTLDVSSLSDIVAKVFLRGGTQILRPAGAAIKNDVEDRVAKRQTHRRFW